MTKPGKPPYGSPLCNGCGQCCMDAPCYLGAMFFNKTKGRCPALEEEPDRFVCGMAAHPEMYAPVRAVAIGIERLREAALLLIGSGIGCDAQLVGEPDSAPGYQMLLHKERRKRTPKARRAVALWGL